MTCPSCGHQNPPGMKFCGECGIRLASGCPGCGFQNPPGMKFCGQCGTTLAASAESAEPRAAGLPAAPAAAPFSVAPPAAATTERRLVSVLFADLVGFTARSDGAIPEQVREFLARYFDLCREIVERYDGTVEKFIGDAVMAIWGTPVAREDDAERAVRAGLELVDAIRHLGRQSGDEVLDLRAGVLTGEAAVAIGAVGQGMVAGDLVNTASRLQSVAPPGTVLVGEATKRAASGAIVFEEAGDQILKGKPAPVPAWRALRVVAERGGVGRAEGIEAPFVGRDDELRLLKDFLHATSRERRVRLLSVTGQSGIGKSRLAWELLKYIDGVSEDIYWHQGRSPSYGEGLTFWALGEMVRRRAGLREDDDAATTRERIAATLAEFVDDAAERRRLEPALLSLLGIGEPPAGGRAELFTAWRTFFERIALQGTTVLVFEDLQWADAGLVEFIDHLLEWSIGYPILVITLARPDLLERRPDWGAGRRNFVALALGPLSDEAMRELLAGLVPGLPATTVRAILQRADGIPLYAVETIRMLVEDGRLAEDDGVFRPTGDLGELKVPDTLHALIAARLDALDAADRSLIQDGSVLGQSFTVSALAAHRRRAAGCAGAPSPRARPPRDPPPRHGSPVTGARPVRVHAGPRARGRLRDALEAGPPDEAPRRCPPLRVARRRGGGRRPGHALQSTPTTPRRRDRRARRSRPRPASRSEPRQSGRRRSVPTRRRRFTGRRPGRPRRSRPTRPTSWRRSARPSTTRALSGRRNGLPRGDRALRGRSGI